MRYTLTIDRFEADKAVLKTEQGDSIIWPRSKLPQNSREGMVLTFNITDNIKAAKDKEEIAKDILNEILNTES